jgi:hypothetical protein
MIRELMDIFVQKNTYTTLIRHPSGEVTIQDEKEGEEKLTLLPAPPFSLTSFLSYLARSCSPSLFHCSLALLCE